MNKETIISKLKERAEEAKQYGIPQFVMGINDAIDIIQRELEEPQEGQYGVYDNFTHDINIHDSRKEAEEDYESAKEFLLEDRLSGDEQIILFEVKKVASLIEDTEIKDDSKESGFDFWFKWQDN